MIRYLAVASLVAILSGCAGTQAGLDPTAQQQSADSAQQVMPAIDALSLDRRRSKCPASPSGSGILHNGDFSHTANPQHGNGDEVVDKGHVFAHGWRATRNSIDFLGSKYWDVAGLCSVDLDGYFAVGAIEHEGFPTSSGSLYTVSFLLSGNPDCNPTIKTMRVTAAKQSMRYTWDTFGGHNARNGDYTQESWQFTAGGPRTILRFRSLDPKGSGCGAVVAGISVTANEDAVR